MSSLPEFFEMDTSSHVESISQEYTARPVKTIPKSQFITYFSKFKKYLINYAPIYLIDNESVTIHDNDCYYIEILADGVFNIKFKKTKEFLRVITYGRNAFLQISNEQLKRQSGNVINYIPSPLSSFINISEMDAHDNDPLSIHNNEESDEASFDETYDDDEFEFMFSREAAPFIGGYHENTSLYV